MKRVVKWSVGIVIGVVSIWFSCRKVDWSLFIRQLLELSPKWLLISIPPFAITHLFRTKRWKIMLSQIKEIPFLKLYSIGSVGFLAIAVLPFRLGEFTRPLLLKKKYGVSFSSGTATIFIERIFDGLITTFFLVFGVYFTKAAGVEAEHVDDTFKALANVSMLMFSICLVGCVLLVKYEKIFILLLQKLRHKSKAKWIASIERTLLKFNEGMAYLPSLGIFIQILLQSLAVWGVMLLAYYAMARAFEFQLPWTAPFCLVGLSSLGMMIPGPPGGVGVFHAAIQMGLALFGVERSAGLAYAVVFFMFNLIYNLIAGLWGSHELSTSLGSVVSTDHETSPGK